MRLVIGLIASISLFAGCGDGGGDERAADPAPSATTSSAAPEETFRVSGTFELTDPSGVLDDGYNCQGEDGYDDLKAGAQVVVRDASGTQLAIGELGNGDVQASGTCRFGLMVFGVPATSDIYTIEVAGRGEVSFTQDDAESGLALNVGD